MPNTTKIVVNNQAYEVIATYTDDNTQKNYIIYTNNQRDNTNKLQVFASLYTLVNNEKVLRPLETNEDQMIIRQVIDTIMKK